MQAYYEDIFNTFDLDILSKYTLVFENTLSKNLNKDLDLLRNISALGKRILLMYDSNPVWEFEDYFVLLSSHIDNVFLSSANLINLWSKHPRIVYFPTFYFTQLQEVNYQTFDKKYRFSFLSNKPRFHRIYFYYMVKNVISDNDVFSINNKAFNREWWKELFIKDMRSTIGNINKTIEQDLPFITHNARICNEQLNTTNSYINDHSNKHIAYDSYFNITGETNIEPNKVFLTEKTWKAVRSGVIPIFLESNSTFNALAKIGFKFDNEINAKNLSYIGKIDHIKKYMKNLSIDKSCNIYTKELPNIKKNIEWFNSNALNSIFTSHIRSKLNL